ncbi:MAG TPA: response regulator [Alphaproteobacteria bacterium]|nr:response regulator [Alphaproteobacteria bacterium]
MINRWLHPFILSIVTLTWVSGFVILGWSIHHWIAGLALFLVGGVTLIGLFFGLQGYQAFQNLLHRNRVMNTALQTMASYSELVVLDETGKTLWSTHPHYYPNLEELSRRLLLTMEPSQDLTLLQEALFKKKPLTALLAHQRDGLRENGRWILARLSPLDMLGGAKEGVVLLLQDLTSYFSDMKRLQETTKTLEGFIDLAPFGLFYLSPSGHIIGLNQTLANWLNLPKKSLLGERLSSILPSTPLKDFDCLTIGAFSSQTTSFDGYIFTPSREKQFNDPYLVCKQPSLSQEFALTTKSLVQDSVLATVILNQSGEIESYNQAFLGLLQKDSSKEILDPGEEFFALVLPSMQSEVSTKIRRAFEHGSSLPFEVCLKTDSVHLTAYISVLKTQPVTAMLIFVDASEQKRLERQFIQSQKMQAVGQLAGGIAHDFNNLLTAMIGYCDLLLQRYMPSDPSYTDVVQIKQNGTRAANLVRQLLAFSRQQTLQPKVLVITDTLGELSMLLRRLIGADIDLKMFHDRDLWPIKVDPSQLEQVIINLVVNARDAMNAVKTDQGHLLSIKTQNFSAHAPIRLAHETMPAGDYVLIEVKDTGHGIAPEHMDRLFEPFFSTKEVGSGTGLGLSTVYGIVKQTDGFVVAENSNGTSFQGGAIFKIYFPKYAGALEEAPPPQHQEPSKDLTGGGTILLVEDEQGVRQFSARALREKGYKVIEADSGESALEIITKGEEPFDLIVTDVVMPKIDGPTLIKKARLLKKDLKVIFISGYTEDTFRKDLDQTSKIHFLPKPFTLKELAAKVKEVLYPS